MRDEIETYEAKGVRPFGVNPASVEKHRGYAAKLNLPFPLISDPGSTIARAYQATHPFGIAIARTVYLIGRDGAIRFAARGAPGPDLSLASLDKVP